MMTDIPAIKASNLSKDLRRYAGAAQAVRDGIATHAQRHREAQHAAREQLAAQRKLMQGGK